MALQQQRLLLRQPLGLPECGTLASTLEVSAGLTPNLLEPIELWLPPAAELGG
jgi:hypothetical protein